MPTRTKLLGAGALVLFASSMALAAPAAEGKKPEHRSAAAHNPKYYFKIVEINLGKNGDTSLEPMAREMLEKELRSRAEFTSSLGGATDDAAVLEALKNSPLRGFKVSLRLDRLAKDLKEP